MNAKRLSTAFVIALAVSALCTWILGRKMGTHAAEHTAELHYVAALRPLQAGEVIKAEDLELVSWPVSNPIIGGYVKVEDLVGRAVLYPTVKDQPLTDLLLAAAGSGLGLSTRIPDGMRAIALRSDEIMGVAGFIYPGSHLDVLVTYPAASGPVTFTVLENAEVLAVGQKAQPDPDGKPATATVVTLLLTPEDAERAVMASSQGSFHFVLRSGSDKTQASAPPITMARLAQGIGGDYSAPPVTGERHVAAPSTISVQTIAGDKASTDTFSGGR